MLKKWLIKSTGILLILISFGSCSTVMNVTAVDPAGKPITDALILVNGYNIGKVPDAHAEVTNIIGFNTVISAEAEGYKHATKAAEKEIKIPLLIGGIFGFLPFFLWCKGVKPNQIIVLTPLS